jgi:hypothetical protein
MTSPSPQIYNEAIFDLLDITTQPHEITLHEDGRGRLAVAGLRAADVRSEQEALALFFEVGPAGGRDVCMCVWGGGCEESGGEAAERGSELCAWGSFFVSVDSPG